MRNASLLPLACLLCVLAWAPLAQAERQQFSAYYSERMALSLRWGHHYSVHTYPPNAGVGWGHLVVSEANGANAKNTIFFAGSWDGLVRIDVPEAPSGTTASTKAYRLMLVPTTPNCGTVTFYVQDDGTSETHVYSSRRICGDDRRVRWAAGDCFTSDRYGAAGDLGPYTTDPYLQLFTSDHVYWDDDSGEGLNSKLCMTAPGEGILHVGSYSRYSEGLVWVEIPDHGNVQNVEFDNEVDLDPFQCTGTCNTGVTSTHSRVTWVSRRNVTLTAGSHEIRTGNLRGGMSSMGYSVSPDPVLYVVDPSTHAVVAHNDDESFSSTASRTVVVAPTSKTYQVIVYSYSNHSGGVFDLLVDNAVKFKDEPFQGYRLNGKLKDDGRAARGDCIETMDTTGDPFLYWITPTAIVTNDDSAGNLNSRICWKDLVDSSASTTTGWLILGSFSKGSSGNTVMNWVGSFHRRPDEVNWPF